MPVRDFIELNSEVAEEWRTIKTLELSIKIAGKMDKSLMAALNGSQSQISSFARSISSIGTAGLAGHGGTLATATVATIASCTRAKRRSLKTTWRMWSYVDGLADATGKISDKVADNGKDPRAELRGHEGRDQGFKHTNPLYAEDLTRLPLRRDSPAKPWRI